MYSSKCNGILYGLRFSNTISFQKHSKLRSLMDWRHSWQRVCKIILPNRLRFRVVHNSSESHAKSPIFRDTGMEGIFMPRDDFEIESSNNRNIRNIRIES